MFTNCNCRALHKLPVIVPPPPIYRPPSYRVGVQTPPTGYRPRSGGSRSIRDEPQVGGATDKGEKGEFPQFTEGSIDACE